jgi:hypothetical protein
MTTYFHEDLSSWSQSVAVKEAISEVRASSDLTNRNASLRRANDDQERRAHLSWAEILFHFPDAIMEVAAATQMTTGALRERRDVYAATVQAGAMEELLAMTLSYTNHRGLVGIRIKEDGSAKGVTIEDRIAAAWQSVERNHGTFKEDDEFFRDIGVLPPANNFNRVIQNLVRSDEYADEKLDDPDTYAALVKVLKEYEKRGRRKPGSTGIGGSSGTLSKESTATFIASRVTVNLSVLVDLLEEITGVPLAVLLETENWDIKIGIIRELSKQHEPAGGS